MESVSNVPTPESVETKPKYCGKYESPEALEKGYLESQKYIETLREQIKAKEASLAEYAPPEDYKLPETFEEKKAKYLKDLAKSAQLTQKQIDTIANNLIESDRKAQEFFEQRKKDLGEDLNKIKNYAELNYPNNKALQEVIINTALSDKDVMNELLAKRESMLNTALPQGAPAQVDTLDTLNEEYNKVYDEYYLKQDPKLKRKLKEIGDRIYELENNG